MLSKQLPALLLFLCYTGVCSASQDWFDGISDDLPNVPAAVQQLHHKMLAHKNANELDPAIDASLEIVDNLVNGPEESLIRPLLNLALLQLVAKQPDQAISNLQRCIDLIETTEGVFSPLLIQPLFSLGSAHKFAGSHNEAVSAFRRAQHVIHRQDGVYSFEQLDVIEQLTILSIAEGDINAAGREQYFYLKINESEYGNESLELIPALDKYAQYLKDVGRFQGSIAHYKRAIAIIENIYGNKDIRLIEHLQGIADVRLYQQEALRYGLARPVKNESRSSTSFNSQQTNRRNYLVQHPERVRTNDGEDALERALSIISDHPESDITDHIHALVRLGDMYTITGDSRATDLYKQAFELMAGREDLEELNNDLFGLPTRIQPKNAHVLPIYTMVAADTYYADAELTVKPNGRTGNIRIVDSNIPNQERKTLKRMLFLYRYRPRMVDGELVATSFGIHQLYYPVSSTTNAATSTMDTETITSESGTSAKLPM